MNPFPSSFLPLFFFFLLPSLITAYCPNNCSSPEQGTCSPAKVCICAPNWAGDDCSIADMGLRNGVVVAGEVGNREWRYFHVLANSQQVGLLVEVNQTSVGGDLDVYVRLEKYPTRQDYDMRDISVEKEMDFEIPSPHGVYYIGIYGFLKGSYSIVASLKTVCPNDCSGHGICNFDATCTCHQNYGSLDCSQNLPSLLPSVPTTGNLAKNEWDYFILSNNDNTVRFTLSVASFPDQDCDLFVRKDGIPTKSLFDFRDTSTSSSSDLIISGAEVGDYYVGVVGYVAASVCEYSLVVETYSECPNRCSGETHGSCMSETYLCNCNDQYSGDTCETKDAPLHTGDVEKGHLGGHLWNYYHFVTATETNVLVNLMQTNQGGDCDLYLRKGQNPTVKTFDDRDITFGKNVTLTLENPGVASWFIGVYGYKACEYELSLSYSSECPNACSGHGRCQEGGHCECDAGWVTQDCSKESENLENGVKKSGLVQNGQWRYYHFDAIPGSIVTILIHEIETSGFIWGYESLAETPSTSVYDETIGEGEEEGNVHKGVVTLEGEGRVRVGVYGSYLGTQGVDYPFEIVAWQAIFE